MLGIWVFYLRFLFTKKHNIKNETKLILGGSMKKIILMVILMAVALLSANNILHKTLPNGMEIAVKENTGNTSVGFYCFIKTGSVNEGKYLGKGISHYLEHVVSGGTTKFRTEAEYEELGKEMGSIVNAYTTNAVTAFHIIVDKQYQDQALEILAEQVQHCSFDTTEVAREKQVILKEIVMRSTPPRSKVYQRTNELIYPHSNMRYPVIGYPELYKTITRDELADYYYQRYVPNNMVFVAVGDFVAEEMLEAVENTFIGSARKQIEPVYLPTQNKRPGEMEFVEEFEIQQATVNMSVILPQADAADETALSAALEILFSKRKSPIKFMLTEKLKLVNYIYAYANLSPTSQEGTINIIFEAKDPSKSKEIIKIIDDEIEKYSKSGFTNDQIQNIITRKKARKLLSNPGVDQECNHLGWNIMLFGVPDTYESDLTKLEQLTVTDLENALNKHILPKDRVVFYAVPKGAKELLESSEHTVVVKTEPKKYDINKNLTLIHKKNNEKPFIQGVFYFPIYDSYETAENIGSIEFMTDMMFKGSKKYDPLDITEWKEDHSVTFYSWIDEGFYVRFRCLKDDYPTMKDMIFDAIENPSFPESEIELAKERKAESYKRNLSDASSHHADFRSQILYKGQKDGISKEERLNVITDLTEKEIRDIYKKYFNAQSAIVTFFGDMELEEAKKYANEVIEILPDRKIKETYKPMIVTAFDDTFENKYEFEQVNIDLNFAAPSLADDDFNAMRVLQYIFSGSRGRIHKAVRGRDKDLAYFAHPTYANTKDYGYLRITTQTSVDKKDELIQVLKDEVNKIKTELVSDDELHLAIEESVKIMKTYMNDNSLPYYMTKSESRGLGFDYIFTSESELKKITPEDIKRVANKYFNNTAVFVSVPNEDVKLMVD